VSILPYHIPCPTITRHAMHQCGSRPCTSHLRASCLRAWGLALTWMGWGQIWGRAPTWMCSGRSSGAGWRSSSCATTSSSALMSPAPRKMFPENNSSHTSLVITRSAGTNRPAAPASPKCWLSTAGLRARSVAGSAQGTGERRRGGAGRAERGAVGQADQAERGLLRRPAGQVQLVQRVDHRVPDACACGPGA